ncbi:YceI family protein [Sphingomonas sp. AR_OL41]|uniref:YceI family protein n=1 Tax=Sphingomonas sp. AR_OL41 TaxID=3042729 RepID=UPI00247FC90C|nr:YceI family protein [Sphingomonas sp. AR_OL41]MDH7971023.1 YceI family protein [Sphingomonas sp. AR_OL41]
MRHYFLSVFAIPLMLAAPLVAQQMPTTPPGAPIASRVTAGTHTIDGAHTQVLFTVNHLGFSNYTGQFAQPSGTLVLDPKNPSRDKVEVTFQIDKVQTTVPALDAHLKKPEFFDSTMFPEGKFVSTRVTVKGMTATIAGNLTLKGVTRPVILQARFIGAGKAPYPPNKTNIGFTATTSIKRSDFGISYGVPLVSDKVDLTINAAFEAQ